MLQSSSKCYMSRVWTHRPEYQDWSTAYCKTTPRPNKNGEIKLNRFLNVYHWQILWVICNKMLLKLPPHLAHYLVKIFATRNCHVDEMCETIWHERLKLSCNIRPFKSSRWKSTVWRRSEHYSIN